MPDPDDVFLADFPALVPWSIEPFRRPTSGLHAVVPELDAWACRACEWIGDLRGACGHVVAHQWVA